MIRTILGRLAALVPVLFGLCVLSFGLLAMVPGDPVTAMLGLEADPAAIAALRAKYALDDPLVVRFFAWFVHVLVGDLGRSIQTGRSVTAMIGSALVPTLQLGAAAMVVSLLVAIPSGIIAARVIRMVAAAMAVPRVNAGNTRWLKAACGSDRNGT